MLDLFLTIQFIVLVFLSVQSAQSCSVQERQKRTGGRKVDDDVPDMHFYDKYVPEPFKLLRMLYDEPGEVVFQGIDKGSRGVCLMFVISTALYQT